MIWKPSGEERHHDPMWGILAGSAMLALFIGLLEILAIVNIVQAGPMVGDIVVFRAADHVGIDEEPLTIAYAAPNGAAEDRTCVLDPKVMTADGGSLVVEEGLTKAKLYRVHWSGEHTTQGSADCGHSADLTVSATDLRMLASSTGQLGPDGRIASRL